MDGGCQPDALSSPIADAHCQHELQVDGQHDSMIEDLEESRGGWWEMEGGEVEG